MSDKTRIAPGEARELSERIGRVLSVTPMDEWLPESELLYQADGAIAELLDQLGAAQSAIRELHENMWTVQSGDGPEYVSPEGLKYLRCWFDRTNGLLGESP